MKSLCVTLVLVLALCAVSAAATVQSTDAAAGKAVTSQTTCPILGNKIDKSLYADYQGKRVYFCCAGCSDAFKKDPAKYVKKLEDAGVTLEKTPTADDKKATDSGGAKPAATGDAGMKGMKGMDHSSMKMDAGCCQ